MWQETPANGAIGIVHWRGKLNQDGDGANGQTGGVACYGPNDTGLDYTANAGSPGNWFGVATDSNGNPYIQQPTDPDPGAYISTTSYQWSQFAVNDVRRYLDAAAIPFIVVNGIVRRKCAGICVGSQAWLMRISTQQIIPCIVGDSGPNVDEGESSIYCGKLFNVGNNPRGNGPEDDEMDWLFSFLPGTAAVLYGTTYNLLAA